MSVLETILPRWGAMSNKKRRSHRDLRPGFTSSGTSRATTHIPDPRAERRFAVGQRVEWNDCGPVYYGVVVGFVPNAPCEVRVRLDDGRVLRLPSFANSLRHASTPIPGVEVSGLLTIPKIDHALADTIELPQAERTPVDRTPATADTQPADSGCYASIEVEEPRDLDEVTTPECHPAGRNR